jgi:hypothetical protein
MERFAKKINEKLCFNLVYRITVKPMPLGEPVFTVSHLFHQSGNKFEPSITLSDNVGTFLSEDADYILYYLSNLVDEADKDTILIEKTKYGVYSNDKFLS